MSWWNCCQIAFGLLILNAISLAIYAGYDVRASTKFNKKQISLEKQERNHQIRLKELEKKNGSEIKRIEELEKKIQELKEKLESRG